MGGTEDYVFLAKAYERLAAAGLPHDAMGVKDCLSLDIVDDDIRRGRYRVVALSYRGQPELARQALPILVALADEHRVELALDPATAVPECRSLFQAAGFDDSLTRQPADQSPMP